MVELSELLAKEKTPALTTLIEEFSASEGGPPAEAAVAVWA